MHMPTKYKNSLKIHCPDFGKTAIPLFFLSMMVSVVVSVKDRLYLLYKYSRRLGIFKGVYYFFNIFLCLITRNHRTIKIDLPGLRPLNIRIGTSDVPTFHKIFIYEEYDLPVFIKDPHLIIDGGANVGYASLFFSKKFPEARIISIEPERSNYDLLVHHTKDYANITPVRAALWKERSHLCIQNPTGDKWAFRVGETDNKCNNSIEAITVPDLLSMANADYIDILKLDIEGAEKELFEGEPQWLYNVKSIIIELHDYFRPGCKESFYRATAGHRFKKVIKGENIFLIKELQP